MKKLKSTLLAVSAVCVIAGTALTATSLAAAEGYRDVTLTGTNVFYAGVGGASIAVTRISDDSEEGYTDYTSFLIGEDENITYRKNLAYSWYSAGENGGGVKGGGALAGQAHQFHHGDAAGQHRHILGREHGGGAHRTEGRPHTD